MKLKIMNKQQLLQYLYVNYKHKIYYPIKKYYNSIIPLNIYQTWHTKNLPPLMLQNMENIKQNNPKFNYQLFDDNDCYKFIKNNFDENVLNAYNSLIPGAYKADLWRYCILYIKGGIYLDIKYGSLNNFKFINMTEKEHFVLDANKNGIYNALLVTLPLNQILLKAIHAIVENVKNKFYGKSILEPTGPLLLYKCFTNNDRKQIDMYHIYNTFNYRYIVYNNYIILKSYNNYRNESAKFQKIDHYSKLWSKRQIYK